MMIRHIRHLLPSYCQGELRPQQKEAVEAHLRRCPRCRQDREDILRALHALHSLPPASAPDTLWERIEAAIPATETTPESRLTSISRPGRMRWPLLAGATALLVIVGIALLRPHPAPPKGIKPPVADIAWKVERLAGAPRIGPVTIGPKGRLKIGEWLETDATAKARVEVASIGEMTVAPNTRLRLLRSRGDEHRLSLPIGKIHAHIAAPPRLFIIETPAATAIDLGCTYTLNVNAQGDSVLYVELGYVALTVNGREAIVPGWAFCEARRGLGTGTPYFKNANAAFIQALRRYDFERGGLEALQTVLAHARHEDTLTLWHLLYLQKATEPERNAIVDRLTALVPLPPDVTRDAMVRLDDAALLRWKTEMTRYW